MIIALFKGMKLYMMPFYSGCVDFDMRVGPVDADFSLNVDNALISDAYLKLTEALVKKGEKKDQEIKVFINDYDSRFFTVACHEMNDNEKLQEYIKWNIKKLANTDNYYYSYFFAESGICIQFIESQKLDAYLNCFKEFKNKINTIDCQIFNEINYFGSLFKIDVKKNSVVLKFYDEGLYVINFDSNGLCSSKNIEYEFSDSFERKQGGADEPHRIALINDLTGRITGSLNELTGGAVTHKTAYMINSSRVDIPYYLKLQLSKQITNNLFYVNQKFEEKYNGSAFDHMDFCFEALTFRWSNKK